MRSIAFPTSMPSFETERLILRAIEHNDAPLYFALCSQEATMRPYGIRVHRDVTETQKTVEFLANEFAAQRGMRFGVFLKSHNTIIGDVGFWTFDKRRLRAEAGMKLSVAHARKGYMTEASRMLIGYAFFDLGLNAIEANAAVDNVASVGLLEKLGFEKIGTRRQFSFCAESQTFHDSHLYNLLSNDVRSLYE